MLPLWSKGLNLYSDLKLEFSYDSNILRLSEADEDQFLDNEKPEKYQIETLDDLIMSMDYEIGSKNYWLGGHTQKHEIDLNFDKYLKNSIKDNGYIGYNFTQYLNSQFDFSLRYAYYPEIYLRQYKSVIDDQYHEFKYSKNFYRFSFNYDLISAAILSGNLEYSQLFYDEWFTEYDCDIITSNVYLTLKPQRYSQLKFRYGYRVSDAEGIDAYSDDPNIGKFKDASYEANIYACDLKIRNLPGKATLNIGFKLESRFYDSKQLNDDYHILRDDYIHQIDLSVYKPLNKNLSLLVSGEYGFRNTDSPFEYVTEDKEYDYWKGGVTFSYDFLNK